MLSSYFWQKKNFQSELTDIAVINISCLYIFSRDVAIPVQSRICFIKFSERDTVGVAQHLTNVVFIDRALLVIPYLPGELPDELKAIELLNSSSVFPALAQEMPWPEGVKNEVSIFIAVDLQKNNLSSVIVFAFVVSNIREIE